MKATVRLWKTLSLPIPHPLAFCRFPAERTALDRRKIQVETAYGTADVKVCSYKGKNYCYPEYDSVSALCDKQEKADFNTVYQAAAKAAKEQL